MIYVKFQNNLKFNFDGFTLEKMRNFGKLGRLNFEKKPILGKVTENKKSSECKIKINQTGFKLQHNIFLSSVNM